MWPLSVKEKGNRESRLKRGEACSGMREVTEAFQWMGFHLRTESPDILMCITMTIAGAVATIDNLFKVLYW